MYQWIDFIYGFTDDSYWFRNFAPAYRLIDGYSGQGWLCVGCYVSDECTESFPFLFLCLVVSSSETPLTYKRQVISFLVVDGVIRSSVAVRLNWSESNRWTHSLARAASAASLCAALLWNACMDICVWVLCFHFNHLFIMVLANFGYIISCFSWSVNE